MTWSECPGRCALDVVLVTARGFGGFNSCMVLRRCTDMPEIAVPDAAVPDAAVTDVGNPGMESPENEVSSQ